MNSPFDAATLAGFELAMTASPNPMLLVDDEGSIAMANPAAESLFGRSVVGSPVEKLLPQERAEHHAQLRRAWMANPTPRPMGRARDLVALRVDGERMPVEIGLTTFRRDGRTWTMCSVVDLSTRRRLEAEREAAWGRALQAQRLEGLGLLAGGVAHDFNNLLVGVIGNANLAIGVLQPVTTAHDYVQDLLRAAQQA